jgi:predicted N-acetyltransferase YhbS
MSFTIRTATEADIPALDALMNRAIETLLKPFLSPEQVEASHEVMGLDRQLIADRSYLVAEENGVIVGCGGWSRRGTLYGGDHTKGRDASLLDPTKDAARVRAMYTDPGHARRGIGRAVIDACEAEAAKHGFSRVQLVATMGGEPLYKVCGYREVERMTAMSSKGVGVPLVLMEKALPRA